MAIYHLLFCLLVLTIPQGATGVTCDVMDNVRVDGTEISLIANRDSAECCDDCAANGECTIWTCNTKTLTCYLYRSDFNFLETDVDGYETGKTGEYLRTAKNT